nr:hypothetical protein [Nocardioides convexus]
MSASRSASCPVGPAGRAARAEASSCTIRHHLGPPGTPLSDGYAHRSPGYRSPDADRDLQHPQRPEPPRRGRRPRGPRRGRGRARPRRARAAGGGPQPAALGPRRPDRGRGGGDGCAVPPLRGGAVRQSGRHLDGGDGQRAARGRGVRYRAAEQARGDRLGGGAPAGAADPGARPLRRAVASDDGARRAPRRGRREPAGAGW